MQIMLSWKFGLDFLVIIVELQSTRKKVKTYPIRGTKL